MPLRHVLAAFLLAALPALACQADEVQVAVASNFAAPMRELSALFEQASGHQARLAFGATGKFYAQIRNGAPFDVLLAADDKVPARLAQEGDAVESSRFTYAIGRLVLWSPSRKALDENALKTGDFRHLAVANPKTAPYGAAAMDTLEHLGLAEPLRARLVQGENIAQTHQFVASGNAELGFVALSQVIRNGEPDGGWLVPGNYHRPIRQDAVLLERGASNPAAVALLAFLREPAAREVIERYGYRVP